MEDEEKEFPKLKSKGTITSTGYLVEARYMYDSPANFGGQILDQRWRKIKFEKSLVGIPQAPIWAKEITDHGLLSHSAAQALRWWFVANAEASQQSSLSLETRIVIYEIKLTHDINAISAGEMS